MDLLISQFRLFILNALQSQTSVTPFHLPTNYLPLDVLSGTPSHHDRHQAPSLFFPAPLILSLSGHPVSVFGWECQGRGELINLLGTKILPQTYPLCSLISKPLI